MAAAKEKGNPHDCIGFCQVGGAVGGDAHHRSAGRARNPVMVSVIECHGSVR